MKKAEKHLREAIVDACRWMSATGLSQGTSGNVSARHGDTMPITPTGTRPRYDDKAESPSAVTRDDVLDLDPPRPGGRPPLLSALGGEIMTCRRLAGHALERLRPFLPAIGPAWTAAPSPAGLARRRCRD